MKKKQHKTKPNQYKNKTKKKQKQNYLDFRTHAQLSEFESINIHSPKNVLQNGRKEIMIATSLTSCVLWFRDRAPWHGKQSYVVAAR